MIRPTSTALRLYRALHGRKGYTPKPGHIPTPKHPHGMGTLAWMEVETPHGLQTWTFAPPKPKLTFSRLTADAHGRSQLHVVGGAYRVGPDGLHNLGSRAPSHLRCGPPVRGTAAQRSVYVRSHWGVRPRETCTGRWPSLDRLALVPAGRLRAVTYWTEKGTEGPGNYRHRYAFRVRPTLYLTPDARQIVLHGGAYTVTPHGIEDAA